MMAFLAELKRSVFGMALAGAVLVLAGTGCESDSDSDDDGGADVVGTWALYSGGSIQGSPYWYIHFKPDGTYTISDNADGSARRVSGSYTTSGNTITGPFTNPGVGDGRIDATLDNGLLRLNFVEYWHTPNKVVPYTGKRI